VKFDPLTVPVQEYAIDPSRVLGGDPRPSASVMWRSPADDVRGGIWEVAEGTLGDVDVDEMVYVVAGLVTVTFDDTGESLELTVGDLVTFTKGRTMTWHVHERFRAVFNGLAF